MKTETVLTRVNEIREAVYNGEQFTSERLLAALADDLAAQLRKECAAARGQGSALRTVTALLNTTKKVGGLRPLEYAWIDKQGRQCVCDRFRAFRLSEHLPLEDRPEDIDPQGIDLEKVFPSLDQYVSAPLPSAKEVKTAITLERAQYGRQYTRSAPKVWDFGEYKPAVNMGFLLDLLTVFPDATVIYYNPSSLSAPLYASGRSGEAIILPAMLPVKQRQKDEISRRSERAANWR